MGSTDVVATRAPTAAAQPELVTSDPWRRYDWNDMPPQYQNAWSVLGYNQLRWDTDQEPPALSVDWCELTPAQQEAANALGFSPSMWDNNQFPSVLPPPDSIQLR